MSFTGDLEHLPIVDVIQLLHSTRKSGTLCVRGGRGECQLVFNDGYICSANHSNTSVRIGKLLVDMQLISSEICEKALADQQAAGSSRKPLIATLIEQGQLKKDDAFKGLKNLIEMTVVEMLRWTRGTFTLNVDETIISDEYRYFPEMLHQEINLDTQRVLMDALRVFDEQNRDGGFVEEEWMEEPSSTGIGTESGEGAGIELSADDLGLGDIDRLERKIPEVFASIEVVDPADIHRRAVADLLPEVEADEREKLVDFLLRFSAQSGGEPAEKAERSSRALVFISRDPLARYLVMSLCKPLDILIFTTDDQGDLDLILGQSLNKGMAPLLIFDLSDGSTAGWSRDDLSRLRQEKKGSYPRVSMLQLALADDGEFSLQAYRDGVRAVLPRPDREAGTAVLIRFFQTLMGYVKDYFEAQGQLSCGELKNDLLRLQGLRDAPELSLALLERVAVTFDRALTFIVRPGELIAERGIGIGQDKTQGPSQPFRFKIPLDTPSLFHQVLSEGLLYYGRSDDEVIAGQLLSRIGAPRGGSVLLLPICSRGRALALIYADGPAGFVPVDSLAILAGQAGLILENALCRRQIEKAASPE
jgi:hypothetical protein